MEMKPLLIGFAGRKRSGKTTAAELLMAHHGFAGVSFAQPMRRFVADLLGITLAELEQVKEEPVDWLDGEATPRHMLQTLGTEWGREMVHPELWVRTTMRAADDLRSNGYAVAISDVRFENEAKAIAARGGFVVEITRPDLLLDSVDLHVSEQPLPRELIADTVVNDGDVSQFYTRLIDTLRALRVKQTVGGGP